MRDKTHIKRITEHLFPCCHVELGMELWAQTTALTIRNPLEMRSRNRPMVVFNCSTARRDFLPFNSKSAPFACSSPRPHSSATRKSQALPSKYQWQLMRRHDICQKRNTHGSKNLFSPCRHAGDQRFGFHYGGTQHSPCRDKCLLGQRHPRQNR